MQSTWNSEDYSCFGIFFSYKDTCEHAYVIMFIIYIHVYVYMYLYKDMHIYIFSSIWDHKNIFHTNNQS